MTWKKTPPEEGDHVFVNNKRIKKDNLFGTKGVVLSVSRNQVRVKLLTTNRTEIFDVNDVGITGMF